MADIGNKKNDRIFKKRAHRPWKTSLLEETILEATIDLSDDLFEFNIDLDIEATEDLDSFYPELNVNEEQDEEVSQVEELVLTQRHSKILLGGFFNTSQKVSKENDNTIPKKKAIVASKTITEQEIVAIKRKEAEDKIIAQQFRLAIDQANLATAAHQKEMKLRNNAEQKIRQAQLCANNAELELQNERLLRADDTKQILLLKKQLQELLDQVDAIELEKQNTYTETLKLRQQYDELNTTIEQLKQEQQQYTNEIYGLESSVKELAQKDLSNQYQIANFETQCEQLKEIIATEKELRLIAEQELKKIKPSKEPTASRWRSEKQRKPTVKEQTKERSEPYNYSADDLNF
jgi:chromosome segregation ATPase